VKLGFSSSRYRSADFERALTAAHLHYIVQELCLGDRIFLDLEHLLEGIYLFVSVDPQVANLPLCNNWQHPRSPVLASPKVPAPIAADLTN
jgi:hypothetical protein